MATNAVPRDLNNVPKFGYDHVAEENIVAIKVWNPVSLAWEKMTQPVIDATNTNLYVALDGVEGLLTAIRDGGLGTTPVTGQKLVVTLNTPIALASSTTVKNGVIIQALAANVGIVKVGGSTPNFQLQAGQATSVAVDNLSSLYVTGAAGDGVCYITSS